MKNKKKTTTKKEKDILRNEQGITLVALIITIIVLVILAVVSISNAYNSRVAQYALEGSQEYVAQAVQENQIMRSTEGIIERSLTNIEDIIKRENGPLNPPQALPSTSAGGWHNEADLNEENKRVIIISDTGDPKYTKAVKIEYTINGEVGVKDIQNGVIAIEVDADGEYVIKTRTIDAEGNYSEYSEEMTIKVDATAPHVAYIDEPTDVTQTTMRVTAHGDDEYSGVSEYILQVSTESGFPEDETKTKNISYIVASADEKSHTFDIEGLTAETTYYIRVKVKDVAGNVATMTGKKTKGTKPNNYEPSKPEVSFVSSTKNTITFKAKSTDPENDALTYTIYLGTDRNNLNLSQSFIGNTAGDEVTLTTTSSACNLSENTQYYWKVVASDGQLKGEASEIQGPNKTNSAPSTPTVSKSSTTYNSITLSANSTDTDGDTLTYEVMYGTTTSCTSGTRRFTGKTQGTNSTLQISSLTQGGSYYFKVRATDGKSYSDYSSVKGSYVPTCSRCYNLGEANESGGSPCGGRVNTWSNKQAGYSGFRVYCSQCDNIFDRTGLLNRYMSMIALMVTI